MIPKTGTGQCTLKNALADVQQSGLGGLQMTPALKDRIEGSSQTVRLSSLGGTVMGFHSVSGPWNSSSMDRSKAWPHTYASTYGTRGFVPSRVESTLNGSRSGSSDAVVEARYNGYAYEAGTYVFTAGISRNYNANGGAPGSVILFASASNYLSGNLTILYQSIDFASGFSDLNISHQFYKGAGNGFITAVCYHKIFGTVGGHSQVADQNVNYINKFTGARLRML